MIKSFRQPLAGLLALAYALLAPAMALAQSGNDPSGGSTRSDSGWHLLNMPVGVTEVSRKIFDLHMLILWVCVWIGVVVFGVMIYALIKFRKSQGAVPDTRMVHSTKAEIIWTIVPVLILVAMAVPSARTLIELEDTRGAQLTIKVTGYQWKWQYEYIDDDHGFGFFSTLDRRSDAARQLQSGVDPRTVENYLLDVDNPMVVPENTKVRLLVTAQDVIHAWWVPAFAMKKDAIPGFVNEMWFKVEKGKTGIYRGQCTELCGRDHGFMPVVVRVVSEDEFKTWVAEKRAKAAPPAAPPADAAPTDAAAPAQAALPGTPATAG